MTPFFGIIIWTCKTGNQVEKQNYSNNSIMSITVTTSHLEPGLTVHGTHAT